MRKRERGEGRGNEKGGRGEKVREGKEKGVNDWEKKTEWRRGGEGRRRKRGEGERREKVGEGRRSEVRRTEK